MYISKFCDITGKESIVTDSITEEHLASIQMAILKIQEFLNETDHYIIVSENAKDFINSLKEATCNSETLFIQINRAFSNYLNAFYTWGCFHNHKKSWHYFNQYHGFRDYYQAQNMTYSLANQLRHYTTHNGFAIYKIKCDVLNEKAFYQIAPTFFDVVCESDKVNKKTKQYISSLKSTGIDAYQFTVEFLEMFREFQSKIWEEPFIEIQKEVELLLNIVAPNTPDCYNTYIINPDDNSFFLNVGRFLELYEKRRRLLKVGK